MADPEQSMVRWLEIVKEVDWSLGQVITDEVSSPRTGAPLTQVIPGAQLLTAYEMEYWYAGAGHALAGVQRLSLYEYANI